LMCGMLCGLLMLLLYQIGEGDLTLPFVLEGGPQLLMFVMESGWRGGLLGGMMILALGCNSTGDVRGRCRCTARHKRRHRHRCRGCITTNGRLRRCSKTRPRRP